MRYLAVLMREVLRPGTANLGCYRTLRNQRGRNFLLVPASFSIIASSGIAPSSVILSTAVQRREASLVTIDTI